MDLSNDRSIELADSPTSPGRFFVAHELKIMFAHLIMNYEIKPITEKPAQKWVGRNFIPPKVVIEIRKLKLE